MKSYDKVKSPESDQNNTILIQSLILKRFRIEYEKKYIFITCKIEKILTKKIIQRDFLRKSDSMVTLHNKIPKI